MCWEVGAAVARYILVIINFYILVSTFGDKYTLQMEDLTFTPFYLLRHKVSYHVCFILRNITITTYYHSI